MQYQNMNSDIFWSKYQSNATEYKKTHNGPKKKKKKIIHCPHCCDPFHKRQMKKVAFCSCYLLR